MNKKEFNEIKQKIENQFYNDFLILQKGYNPNNCFFVNFEKIEKGLFTTFNYLMNNFNSLIDLYNLFTMDINKKVKGSKGSKFNIFGFSIKPYILCDNMINNTCKLSKVCYASKQELANKKDKENTIRYYSLEKTLSNYIFYYFIIFANDKENDYKLLKNTLKIYSSDLKKYNVIRFNIKSDFIDQIHLNFCNDLFKILKSNYNYKFAYSYTKTKNLDFSKLDKNFIVNESVIIENESDLQKVDSNKYQFCTIVNKELESFLIGFIPKCKNQTININCNVCNQCFLCKGKFNTKH